MPDRADPFGGRQEPSDQPEWQRLFRRTTPEGALGEIATWIGAGDDLEICLEVAGDAGAEVVRYRGASAPEAGQQSVEATVPGRPDWKLVASALAPLSHERVDRAAWALAAWRVARLEQSRADARLRLQTRDLEVVQALGRKATEAKTAAELFAVVASALHEGAGLDAVAIAHTLGGFPAASVFPSRPVDREAIDLLLRRTGVALGWPVGHEPVLDFHGLPGLETSEAQRPGTVDGDWVRFPLLRRGNPIGELILLPSEPLVDAQIRLAYVASNALSLHLDRILTVRDGEKSRFRSILDSMPQAVFLTDPSLRVLQANRSAETLLAKMGIGDDSEGLHRVGNLDLRPLAAQVLESTAAAADGEARLPTGEILTFTLSALRGDDARTEGLVLVLSDVTEPRGIQEHLAQAEKLGSLGSMLSGVAHELNNPLATVLGFAQLVRNASGDEKLRKRLATIHDEARRCQRIVQNLLRFARRKEPERKPFSLNEATEDVLNLMSYQLRVDGIEIVRELASDLPSVHGDAHDLQQAVLNLLSNAHHAVRAAGRGGTIRIRTERAGPDDVSIEIQDDGPGIPEEIRSKIFDPFFTTKDPGQGTGLGLSLVYSTVAAHGGSVRLLHDRPGTTFRIELPRGTADPTPPSERGSEDAVLATSARILVVDDEASLASLMCEALAADGHEAVPAADGREALDRLSEREFDLVVSDFRMPGIGAARLRREMETLRPGMSSRLLLTTGDTVTRDADILAAELGTDVLHKPFDLDDLRRAVRSRLWRQREH
jgi:signal transduction histidine kinase/CheY-like chemotaxis protein